MSTDKTLADVQPGGRVRLTGQAERARFEAWAESEGWYSVAYRPDRDAPYALNAVEFAWQAFQAALSAQPYPGGQGDALVTDEMVDAACRAYYDAAEDAVAVDHTFMEAALKAALAARQPVDSDDNELQFYREHIGNDLDNALMRAGVFEVIHEGGYEACWENSMDALQRLIDRQPVGEAVELARAKVKIAALELQLATYEAPAQAVDLERFRPAVMTALGLSSPYGLERETLNELLDLIDSRDPRHG